MRDAARPRRAGRGSAGRAGGRAAPRLGTLATTAAVAILVALSADPLGAASQAEAPPSPSFDSTAFLDPAARRIHAAAAANWNALDESVVRYTALIEQRLAAALRTPLKDRVLYRSEAALRAFWDRDHDPVVQVLGSRSRYPGRDIAMREGDLDWLEDLPFDMPFEPGGDRLVFGIDDDDEMFRADPDEPSGDPDNPFWFAHPLAPKAADSYQFRSGDTLSLRLPDGRTLSTVRLDVLPREAGIHRIAGVLWIEPESGALVRAVYRMSRGFDAIRDVPELQREEDDGTFRFVPGIFKPWTFDLKMIAVDYALWDFRVWLPRTMRVEGEAAAGILKFPVSLDVAYRMESVTTEEDADQAAGEAGGGETAAAQAAGALPAGGGAGDGLQHVHFATRAEALRFIGELLSGEGAAYEPLDESEEAARARASLLLAPSDRALVDSSPHLPPPIWEDAAGFASASELEAHLQSLAQLPAAPIEGTPWTAGLGWLGGTGLRYNRIEGPAAGGSFAAELGRRFSVGAEGLLGLANLRPDVRVEFERSTVLRRLSLELFYGLRATDRTGRYLGLRNSMNAFFRGKDEGDYYRAAGAALAWRPPALARESFEVRVYGERHWSVRKETDFALFKAFSHGWTFRPNPAVEELREGGAELRLAPWWGRDPTEAQAGLEVRVRAAAWEAAGTGRGPGGRYADASAVVRAAIPLSGSGWDAWRLAAEAGGGTTWGRAPVQRRFFVGGPATLRGHPRAVASGNSFLAGRVEAARMYHAVSASVFGDVAWAGDRSKPGDSDVLYGIGIGASLIDGLLRLDIARGLNGPDPGFRVHLTLDSIL